MLKRKRLIRRLIVIVAAVLTAVVFFMPSPYVVEVPGPAYNTLGTITPGAGKPAVDVVQISNAQTYPTTGSLYMLTVGVAGTPSSQPMWYEAFWGWFSKNETVMPMEAVYPPGTSTEQGLKDDAKQMSSSQDNAVNAAFNYLDLPKDNRPKVNIDLADVGGPSAGMMLSLAIIDKLTPGSMTGGQNIAGTGTIDSSGTVGEIGGIHEKAIAARAQGATVLLLPYGNCNELLQYGIPQGLSAVPVHTLQDAINALTQIASTKSVSGLPTCQASN